MQMLTIPRVYYPWQNSMFPNYYPSTTTSTIKCCMSPPLPTSVTPENNNYNKLTTLPLQSPNFQENNNNNNNINNQGGDDNDGESDDKSISQIQVSRNKYIPVSKSFLHDALLTYLRSAPHNYEHDGDGDGDGDHDHVNDDDHDESVICHFLLLSSCLDSILHAEHKRILEEMRDDYFSSQSVMNEEALDYCGLPTERGVNTAEGLKFGNDRGNGSVKSNGYEIAELEEARLPFLNGLGFIEIFGSPMSDVQNNDDKNSSTSEVAAATRFQRAFMKLLEDAQFEELSVRDLMLTSALNSDYLLTLPIYVDWKRASKSNAIIFRRGYSTEKQKGLLIVEKLDYLQSKVLQEIFGLISKPLLRVGLWMKEAIQQASEKEDVQLWIKRAQLWLQEISLIRQSYSSEMRNPDAMPKFDHELDEDLPIWLAAQEAVSRYEGFLSSIGPRGRLLRRFLGWIGILPPTPEIPFELDAQHEDATDPHLRPVQLSRITLNDIWRPATRKQCGNNLWRMLKVGFSIIFSQSIIQEPAFQELILLYTEETGKAEIPSWQLKIYENIPVPDLSVIFPHKKLSFRILDTVRLDVSTIIGLLAFLINYKFEDVLSSPSAIMLDVIAVTALIILVIRVGLGYKQTWDRYELLVNRTLYEKTLASGFGSVHFLLDASEQQQYKECILAYGILLKAENTQYTRSSLGEECERFLYNKFKEKVQMPVDKAVDMLIDFGLVLENKVDDENVLQVVPCSSAYDALRKRWDCLLL